ncbi:transcriptional regulator [Vibrio lentus]|uniref:helix-turn-helix transcriptional regulator n=1 Tax=Vibrio lentus TaxID=136468 RepID=UPI000C847B65|nr:helix-turn-helix transcriptional regulator [Vibrio lentus]PMG46197.1 transcriptional regulator [Vibrio lentus]
MADRTEIGLKVKLARNAMGLTQVQVSKLTRINKTTISEIENGRFTGSFDIFERLLNAVNLQFEVAEKTHQLPDWDEIEELFSEDDDD